MAHHEDLLAEKSTWFTDHQVRYRKTLTDSLAILANGSHSREICAHLKMNISGDLQNGPPPENQIPNLRIIEISIFDF